MGAIVSVIFNGFTLVIGFLRKFFPFINKFIGFIGGFLTSRIARVALLGPMGGLVIFALISCLTMAISGILSLYEVASSFFVTISDVSKIDSSPSVQCTMHYMYVFGIIPAINTYLPIAASLLMWFLSFVLCVLAWKAYFAIYKVVSKYA